MNVERVQLSEFSHCIQQYVNVKSPAFRRRQNGNRGLPHVHGYRRSHHFSCGGELLFFPQKLMTFLVIVLNIQATLLN